MKVPENLTPLTDSNLLVMLADLSAEINNYNTGKGKGMTPEFWKMIENRVRVREEINLRKVRGETF